MNQTLSPAADDQRARILVVDDEPLIRSGLARALRLSGFDADVACSGDEALVKLRSAIYDVMVLDLKMPGMNGVEVMQRAHVMCPSLQIVILTGHATLESAISAVKSEADDYLRKPTSAHQVIEVVARVLRRRAYRQRQKRLVQTISQAAEALRQSEPIQLLTSPLQPLVQTRPYAHPLTLDVQRQSVTVDNEERTDAVPLTRSETRVLASLMSHRGQVLSCRQLADEALGYDVDELAAQSLVRPIVFRLRQKIEANPRQHRLIRTVRGSGYFLA